MYYSIIYERIQVDITLIFMKRCAKCYACFWLWRKISLSFQKNPNSALLHFAKLKAWLKSTLHADSSQASLIFWIFHTLFAILSQSKIFSPAHNFVFGFFRKIPAIQAKIYSCRIKQIHLANSEVPSRSLPRQIQAMSHPRDLPKLH